MINEFLTKNNVNPDDNGLLIELSEIKRLMIDFANESVEIEIKNYSEMNKIRVELLKSAEFINKKNEI